MSLDYNKGYSRSVPLRRGASFLWQKSFTINGQAGSPLLLIIPQTEANSSRIPAPAPSLHSTSVACSLPLYNWVLKILVGGGNQRTIAFTFPFFCMWSITFWIWREVRLNVGYEDILWLSRLVCLTIIVERGDNCGVRVWTSLTLVSITVDSIYGRKWVVLLLLVCWGWWEFIMSLFSM